MPSKHKEKRVKRVKRSKQWWVISVSFIFFIFIAGILALHISTNQRVLGTTITNVPQTGLNISCNVCLKKGFNAILLSQNGTNSSVNTGNSMALCWNTKGLYPYFYKYINSHLAAYIDCHTKKLVEMVNPATSTPTPTPHYYPTPTAKLTYYPTPTPKPYFSPTLTPGPYYPTPTPNNF